MVVRLAYTSGLRRIGRRGGTGPLVRTITQSTAGAREVTIGSIRGAAAGQARLACAKERTISIRDTRLNQAPN